VSVFRPRRHCLVAYSDARCGWARPPRCALVFFFRQRHTLSVRCEAPTCHAAPFARRWAAPPSSTVSGAFPVAMAAALLAAPSVRGATVAPSPRAADCHLGAAFRTDARQAKRPAARWREPRWRWTTKALAQLSATVLIVMRVEGETTPVGPALVGHSLWGSRQARGTPSGRRPAGRAGREKGHGGPLLVVSPPTRLHASSGIAPRRGRGAPVSPRSAQKLAMH